MLSSCIDFAPLPPQFLPIPELIPFRLTPQVMNLLLPHKGHGLLRSCMVHTLRALRHSSAPLLNTMDVFVKEPHLEWQVGVGNMVGMAIISLYIHPPLIYLCRYKFLWICTCTVEALINFSQE